MTEKLFNEHVLVVGDSMLDKYVRGNADRISPEAPVIDFHVSHIPYEDKPGGAANVVNNLSSMGLSGYFLTGTGDDMDGMSLEVHVKQIQGFFTTFLQIPFTTTKTRLIDKRYNQCILRISSEQKHKALEFDTTCFLSNLRIENDLDIVGVSDYDKGMISPNILDSLKSFAAQNYVPIIGDPKADNFSNYNLFDCIVPNHFEVANFYKCCSDEVLKNPAFYASRLVNDLTLKSAIITLGRDGASYSDTELNLYGVEPATKRELYDSSGAGDTFFAVVIALWRKLTVRKIISIANELAGTVVEQIGNYKPSEEFLVSETEKRRSNKNE